MFTSKQDNCCLIDKCTAKILKEDSIFYWEIDNFDIICASHVTEENVLRTGGTGDSKPTPSCLLDVDLVKTPQFKRGDNTTVESTWELRMKKDPSYPRHLGLSLHLINAVVEGSEQGYAVLKYSFSIVNASGKKIYPKVPAIKEILTLQVGESVEQPTFIELEQLHSRDTNYINGNKLRIQLDMELLYDVTEDVKSSKGSDGEELFLQLTVDQQPTNQENPNPLLMQLWTTKMFADIQIECGSVILPVHKSIVCGSSHVFDAMFSHEMIENATDKIQIEDMEIGTLYELIGFMYIGNISESTASDFDAVTRLLNAAEKYVVLGLKRKCWKILLESFLTLEYACKLLLLSNLIEPSEQGMKQDLYNYCTRHWHILREIPEVREAIIKYPTAFTPLLMA